MADLQDVFKDLVVECDEVDDMVAGLKPDQWQLDTPAAGWTIAHQIAHLSFVFRLAGTAAANPEAFKALIAKVGNDFDGAVNAALADYLPSPPDALLERWRQERAQAIRDLAAVPPGQAVPWLVRPLPAAILACAGLMEAFAHGQDVADALSIRRTYTDRLEHIAGFAVLTWDFGYQSRGLTPPDAAFRFELTAPSGDQWAFGPEDAEQKITGPAADFCLLVTRRRHRDDLRLTAVGPDADRWLDLAQAYRGPAGPGRAPGQFADLDALQA